MSFNNYLRKKLRENSMMQASLAEAIKTTKATVNRWLKPYSSNPPEKNMRKVIEFFGDDYDEIYKVFAAEKEWGKYFWKNFRAVLMEKGMDKDSIQGVAKEALEAYYDGKCEYVELDDIKAIAESLGCSVESLIDGEIKTIEVIGLDPSRRVSIKSNFTVPNDYTITSSEMEPLIHYGDRVSLKRDYITKDLVVTPKEGDIVLLRNKKDGIISVRRFEMINRTVFYTANDGQHVPIQQSEDYEVVGIISAAVTNF